MEVLFLGKRANYSEEIKWKAIRLREKGYTSREIAEVLGIKNISSVKTWMRWYRNGETHRLGQLPGKQYAYGKGMAPQTELEKKDQEIRQLKAKVAVLEKLEEIARRWGLK